MFNGDEASLAASKDFNHEFFQMLRERIFNPMATYIYTVHRTRREWFPFGTIGPRQLSGLSSTIVGNSTFCCMYGEREDTL